MPSFDVQQLDEPPLKTPSNHCCIIVSSDLFVCSLIYLLKIETRASLGIDHWYHANVHNDKLHKMIDQVTGRIDQRQLGDLIFSVEDLGLNCPVLWIMWRALWILTVNCKYY